MTILAVDIGGTHARFTMLDLQHMNDFDRFTITKIDTQNSDTTSIDDLFTRYQQQIDHSLQLQSLNAIVLAVPGPVYEHLSMPPNIQWNIDTRNLQKHTQVFMLNDFAAQAYACLLPTVTRHLEIVRQGLAQNGSRVGVVGAGTGIGHGTIIEHNGQKIVLPSEAGHATASFITSEEKQLESFAQHKLNVKYIVNDHLINGRGIVLLHEFLTQKVLTAEQIFAEPIKHKPTIDFFARLYGRVCRNYCLTNCIDHKLIISGGLAAKNPELLTSTAFTDEFNALTTESYRPLLDNISILLNKRDDIGLLGAAQFAFDQLKTARAAS